LADQFSGTIENRVTRLFSGCIIAVNKFADGAIVFSKPAFFLETSRRVVPIYSAEEEFPVGPKDLATAEPPRLIEHILNPAGRLAVRPGGGGGGAMIRRIKLIDRARAILIESNTDADGVVRRGGFVLSEESTSAETKRTEEETASGEKVRHRWAVANLKGGRGPVQSFEGWTGWADEEKGREK